MKQPVLNVHNLMQYFDDENPDTRPRCKKPRLPPIHGSPLSQHPGLGRRGSIPGSEEPRRGSIPTSDDIRRGSASEELQGSDDIRITKLAKPPAPSPPLPPNHPSPVLPMSAGSHAGSQHVPPTEQAGRASLNCRVVCVDLADATNEEHPEESRARSGAKPKPSDLQESTVCPLKNRPISPPKSGTSAGKSDSHTVFVMKASWEPKRPESPKKALTAAQAVTSRLYPRTSIHERTASPALHNLTMSKLSLKLLSNINPPRPRGFMSFKDRQRATPPSLGSPTTSKHSVRQKVTSDHDKASLIGMKEASAASSEAANAEIQATMDNASNSKTSKQFQADAKFQATDAGNLGQSSVNQHINQTDLKDSESTSSAQKPRLQKMNSNDVKRHKAKHISKHVRKRSREKESRKSDCKEAQNKEAATLPESGQAELESDLDAEMRQEIEYIVKSQLCDVQLTTASIEDALRIVTPQLSDVEFANDASDGACSESSGKLVFVEPSTNDTESVRPLNSMTPSDYTSFTGSLGNNDITFASTSTRDDKSTAALSQSTNTAPRNTNAEAPSLDSKFSSKRNRPHSITTNALGQVCASHAAEGGFRPRTATSGHKLSAKGPTSAWPQPKSEGDMEMGGEEKRVLPEVVGRALSGTGLPPPTDTQLMDRCDILSLF